MDPEIMDAYTQQMYMKADEIADTAYRLKNAAKYS